MPGPPAADVGLGGPGDPGPGSPEALRRALTAADPPTAARLLLGCRLVGPADGDAVGGGPVVLEVLETEGYGGADDPASHAWRSASRGRVTGRAVVMAGPAGTAYVYRSYGLHLCLNVVLGPAGEPGAVLLRSGRVLDGAPLARRRRAAGRAGGGGPPDVALARGPGNLCAALGVRAGDDGVDLLGPRGPGPRLLPGRAVAPADVVAGPRVGVSRAADRPWRVHVAGAPEVSAYRRARGALPG